MMATFTRSHALFALGLLAGCVAQNEAWDPPPERASADVSTGEDGDREATGSESGGVSGSESGVSGSGSNGADESTGGSVCGELTPCGGDSEMVCVDLDETTEHRGACFNDCDLVGAGGCDAGTCTCPHGEWGRICNGQCADTKKDRNACGEGCIDCEARFGRGTGCKDGVCEVDDGEDNDD